MVSCIQMVRIDTCPIVATMQSPLAGFKFTAKFYFQYKPMNPVKLAIEISHTITGAFIGIANQASVFWNRILQTPFNKLRLCHAARTFADFYGKRVAVYAPSFIVHVAPAARIIKGFFTIRNSTSFHGRIIAGKDEFCFRYNLRQHDREDAFFLTIDRGLGVAK